MSAGPGRRLDGDRARHRSEPSLPAMELAHGLGEVALLEVRPHAVGEDQLGVGALPEQEVRESLLAAGTDQQIDVRHRPAVVVRRIGEEPREDFAGDLLLAGAATCVVLLTSWGGTTFAWDSPVIIGLGLAAVALAVGWWLGNETFSANVLIGLPVVLGAIALHAWLQTRDTRAAPSSLLLRASPSLPSQAPK